MIDGDQSVDHDATYMRPTEYIHRLGALKFIACHRCGSGEVHQPFQTMDMPMYWRCLRCGLAAPSGEFLRQGDGGSDENDDDSNAVVL